MASYDDYLELAGMLVGIEISDETDVDEIEYRLSNRYDIGMSDFINLMKDLVRFTPTWISPISGEPYQGFVVSESPVIMRAIIKEPYNK